MARIHDEDGLFELTVEDLKKVAKGDDSPFHQMHDTLLHKPMVLFFLLFFFFFLYKMRFCILEIYEFV